MAEILPSEDFDWSTIDNSQTEDDDLLNQHMGRDGKDALESVIPNIPKREIRGVTSFAPGTLGKVAVLCRRYEDGEYLFKSGDSTGDTELPA